MRKLSIASLLVVAALVIAALIDSGPPQGPFELAAALYSRKARKSAVSPPDQVFKEDARLDAQSLKTLLPDHKTTKRSRFLKLNADGFKRSVAGGKEQIKDKLQLNLFPDKNLNVLIDASKELAPGKLFGKGKIENMPQSAVTILAKGNRVTGHVYTPAGVYEIRHVRNGEHVVREVDTRLLRDGHRSRRTTAFSRLATRELGIESRTPTIIDFMALYTRQARDLAGSTQNIEDWIDFAVAETNLAYENSGIYQRLRLVHLREVNYQESDDFGRDLDRLMGKNDGYLDTIHALRDQHAADFVTLFIADAADYCGISEPMDSGNYQNYEAFAFNVVKVGDGCLVNLVLAHELGHGMGAQHDYATTGGEYQGLYYYSYGYRHPGGAFRTVMAYDCPTNCPRLPYFSGPNVIVGRDMVAGRIDEVDNARTLNNTRQIVAGLRTANIAPGALDAVRSFVPVLKDADQSSSPTVETQTVAGTLNRYLGFASSTASWQFTQSFVATRSSIEGVSFVIRKHGVPRFAVRVALADEQGSTLGFTTLNPSGVPEARNERTPTWTRITFRDPLQVTPDQRYRLILSTETTDPLRNYSLGASSNVYSAGSLSIRNENPKQLADLLLKIHYRVPSKRR